MSRDKPTPAENVEPCGRRICSDDRAPCALRSAIERHPEQPTAEKPSLIAVEFVFVVEARLLGEFVAIGVTSLGGFAVGARESRLPSNRRSTLSQSPIKNGSRKLVSDAIVNHRSLPSKHYERLRSEFHNG